MNYNMNEIDKLLLEHLSMLRTAEQNISKGNAIMIIQKTKTNGKKRGSQRNPKIRRAIPSPALPV